MKNTVLVSLVLGVIFIYVVHSQPNIGAVRKIIPKHHSSVGADHSISYGRNKRQMGGDMKLDQETASCYSQMFDIYCSSAIPQIRINAFSSCGRREAAQDELQTCAKNEGGEFCYSVLYQLNGYDSFSQGECLNATASNTCVSACRMQLVSHKERIGCCLFRYLNEFDHSVWNLCGASLPDTPCEIPDLSIVEQDCSVEELYSREYAHGACLPNVGQTFINSALPLRQCVQIDAYNSFSEDLIAQCSRNEKGQSCGLLYSEGVLHRYLDEIIRSCRSSIEITNISTCDLSCKSSITAAINSIGCCINLYNYSAFDYVFEHYPNVLSYSLWNRCGFESPGFCDSTFTLTPNGSKSIQGGLTWIISTLTFVVAIISNYKAS